eukprot:s896_g4.t1
MPGVRALPLFSPGPAAELPLLRLDIFTDGSAGSFSEGPLLAPCAWAFSVWAVTPAGAYLIGWAAHDSVPVDTPFWIGEQHEDAVEGETLAIAWALAWVIDWGHAYEVPLLFRYDATAVGAGIFGTQRPPLRQGETRPTELVEYAIALRQRAAFWYRIDHEHVAGHSGHVGNELCDQLAKQARRLREDPYDRLLPVWPQIVFRHPLRAWLWMARLSSPQLPALSALEAEAHRLQTVMGPSPPAPSMGVRTTHLPEVDLVFNLVLSSYNVLTLFDPGVAHGRKARAGSFGMQIAGKRALLKQQMLASGVWALGLQETRLPTNALLPDSDLLMLNAAADDSGSYGFSLWLNLSQPIAFVGNKPRFVRREHVVVTGYSPRHLQAQVCTPWCRLTILVAHCPRVIGQDSCAARAFWAARTHELQRRPDGSAIVLLVDANSRLGSTVTEAVGSRDAELEGEAGALFHEFLLGIGCFVPATFASFHSGSSWTWTAPAAFGEVGRRRIDYVGVPTEWSGFALRS